LKPRSGSALAETVVTPMRFPSFSRSGKRRPLSTKKPIPQLKSGLTGLENEEFKAKLPALLQCPTIARACSTVGAVASSWSGFRPESATITNAITGDFKDSFYPTGVQAFMSQGKSYGCLTALARSFSGIIRPLPESGR
jgi:hypothetical protein